MLPTQRHRARDLSLMLLFAQLALAHGCSVRDERDEGVGDTSIHAFDGGGLDSSPNQPDTGPLTDGEIVGVLLAVHRGDLAVTEYMAANTVRADVRAFATDLHTRHAAAETSLLAAASAAGVTSVDSSIAVRQASLRMQELEAVTSEPCPTRDERYLGLQLLFSAEVLAIVDANLLPAVTSPAIRTEIETARAIIADQAQGLPLPDGATPEASMPDWEAGVPFDSGCPDLSFDAYVDVGPDS